MPELVICEKADLVAIADAIRETTNTTKQYRLFEIPSQIGGEGPLVDGSSLVNYNIKFSFSSTRVTIVVIYSTWTEDGVKITTKDISTTTTLPIL